MEQLRKHHKVHRNYFEGSIGDWLEAAAHPERAHPRNPYPVRMESSRYDVREWAGADTIEEWREILENRSYPRCLALLRKMHKPLVQLPIRRRRLSYDTMGDELDRNRLYSGERECWRVAKRQQVMAFPTIIVNTQGGMTGNNHADRMMWRAVAALNFTDAAETTGFRVKLISSGHTTHCYNNSVNGSYTIDWAVVAKEWNQPLSMSTLSCAMGFAGFFRYVIFNARSFQQHHISHGYGATVGPADLSADAANYFEIGPGVYDEATAAAWVAKAVARIQEVHEEARRAA